MDELVCTVVSTTGACNDDRDCGVGKYCSNAFCTSVIGPANKSPCILTPAPNVNSCGFGMECANVGSPEAPDNKCLSWGSFPVGAQLPQLNIAHVKLCFEAT